MNLNIVYNFTCVFGLMICIWFFVYLFYKKTYSYGLEKIGKELMRGIAVNSKKTFFKVYEISPLNTVLDKQFLFLDHVLFV